MDVNGPRLSVARMMRGEIGALFLGGWSEEIKTIDLETKNLICIKIEFAPVGWIGGDMKGFYNHWTGTEEARFWRGGKSL